MDVRCIICYVEVFCWYDHTILVKLDRNFSLKNYSF